MIHIFCNPLYLSRCWLGVQRGRLQAGGFDQRSISSKILLHETITLFIFLWSWGSRKGTSITLLVKRYWIIIMSWQIISVSLTYTRMYIYGICTHVHINIHVWIFARTFSHLQTYLYTYVLTLIQKYIHHLRGSLTHENLYALCYVSGNTTFVSWRIFLFCFSFDLQIFLRSPGSFLTRSFDSLHSSPWNLERDQLLLLCQPSRLPRCYLQRAISSAVNTIFFPSYTFQCSYQFRAMVQRGQLWGVECIVVLQLASLLLVPRVL